jgi:hypothetical protein
LFDLKLQQIADHIQSKKTPTKIPDLGDYFDDEKEIEEDEAVSEILKDIDEISTSFLDDSINTSLLIDDIDEIDDPANIYSILSPIKISQELPTDFFQVSPL